MSGIKCNRCKKTLHGNQYQNHWKVCEVAKYKKNKNKLFKNSPKKLKKQIQELNKSILKLKNKLNNKNISEKRKFHPVYSTEKWKKLRYVTLRKFNFKCLACNSTDKELHVDHIKPISIYPSLAFEENNLQVLCKDCNLSKSNKFEDDLRNKTM